MNYETVIGLEIHIQLSTDTKMFCGCPVLDFDAIPNTSTCPVCLGLPGALPVPNKKAIRYALMLAQALKCKINKNSIFARKNYFYPDLPKGYQITQDEIPIAEDGKLTIELEDGSTKDIRIMRIHLEEDAGKSFHTLGYTDYTLLDFNRCGVPLIEIVSQPDLSSSREAAIYVMTIRRLVTYMGICGGDMEKGNLRVDANVSVRPEGRKEFGNRTEIKNLNSFKFLQKALDYEVRRHIKILESGERVITETLLWDESESRTFSMRTKEEASDYRYFPEPDLLILNVSEQDIEDAKNMVRELPEERISRFERDYSLEHRIVLQLCSSKDISDYADEVLRNVNDTQTAANWLLTEIMGVLNERSWNISEFPVPPDYIAELLIMMENKKLSRPLAKKVFREMIENRKKPHQIVEEMGVKVIADENKLETIVDEVLAENADAVQKYIQGKTNVLGFLVGHVMKNTRGQADPKMVNQIILKKFE